MLTPTQYLREVALRSGWVRLPSPWKDSMAAPKRSDTAKRRRGEDGYAWALFEDVPMHPTDDRDCWLCGGPTHGKGTPTKKAIDSNFADQDLARAPWSQTFCAGCTFSTWYREFRFYGFLVADDGLRFPTRAEWRDLLLGPAPDRYLACIAESGQKWLSYKARIVISGRWEVQFEDVRVPISDRFPRMVDPIEELLETFTKQEILSGNYNSARIQTFGTDRWWRLESRIRPWRRSKEFELAVFVAQKEVDDGAAYRAASRSDGL